MKAPAAPPLPEELTAVLRRMRLPYVRAAAPEVVHRDLYEEQVLLGEQVGLIDLDDAALGPPELDVGNLLAHLELLGVHSGMNLTLASEALLQGYVGVAQVDPVLLDRVRRLSLLRLACIHRHPLLVSMAIAAASAPRPFPP